MPNPMIPDSALSTARAHPCYYSAKTQSFFFRAKRMAFISPFSLRPVRSTYPLRKTDLKHPNRRFTAKATATVPTPTISPVPSPESPQSGKGRKPSVSLVSLGCPKNVTDAEVMLADLSAHGISVVTPGSDESADVIVVNTCGFVEDAKRESIEAILSAAKQKRPSSDSDEEETSKTKGVIVTGCLAQRYADTLAKELPEIDAVIGFEHYDEIASHVKQLTEKKSQEDTGLTQDEGDGQRIRVGETSVPFRPEHERVRLGPQHSVYVRLAEGCSHKCTFCAIPGQFRGMFRSKPWDSVTSEIEHLAEQGARELIFIAEDTNQYGMDFTHADTKHRLSDLLTWVSSSVKSVQWIRLLYCYPSYFTDELIDAIANLPQVVKYIDIPLQHISDRMLKSMNRPSQAHTLALLDKLRARIPGLVLRTTFITGFPGETQEDHDELLQFVRDQRFQHAGFFTYSEEEGTPAADFDDQVPMEIRQYRLDELTSVQQQIQEEIALEKVGSVLDVMIDRIEDGHSIGRTAGDAPDIDANVHVLQQLPVGEIAKIRILGTSSFDLYGEPVDEAN